MRRDASPPGSVSSSQGFILTRPGPQPRREEEGTGSSWKEARLPSPLETCEPFSEAGPPVGTLTGPCIQGREQAVLPHVSADSSARRAGERADVVLQSL